MLRSEPSDAQSSSLSQQESLSLSSSLQHTIIKLSTHSLFADGGAASKKI